jgi:hypothetical protein
VEILGGPFMDDSQGDFITAFLDFCTKTEIPPIFSLWAAIGGVSCALGRRNYFNGGYFTIYPNLYMVFVAGSGQVHKSTAIKLIAKLVKQLRPSPCIISKQVTPASFIDAMAGDAPPVPRGDKNNPQPPLIFSDNAVACAFPDEFTTLVNRTNCEQGMAEHLIEFFDCPDNYEYKTRTRGVTMLKNVCLTLLAGTTPQAMRDSVPIQVIHGGLSSRFIFIFATANGIEPVPRPVIDDRKKRLFDFCLTRLQEISYIKGEVQMTHQAGELFDAYYKAWYRNSAFFADEDTSGYASRRWNNHGMKLAMVFAASEKSVASEIGGGLLITDKHILAANKMLEETERNMHMVTKAIGQTTIGANITMVLATIAKHGSGVRKDTLIRELSHRLGIVELNELLTTLMEGRQISMEARGNHVYYKYTKAEEKKED